MADLRNLLPEPVRKYPLRFPSSQQLNMVAGLHCSSNLVFPLNRPATSVTNSPTTVEALLQETFAMVGNAARLLRTDRPGLTLIETLISMSTVGVLISLLLPAMNGAREAARLSLCQKNLNQIGVAIAAYESAHGWLPAGQWRRESGGPRYSCFAQVLPYLDEDVLYQKIDFHQPIGSVANKGTVGSPGPTATVMPILLCPAAAYEHPTRADGRLSDVDDDGEVFDDGQMDGVGATDFMPVSGPHKASSDVYGNVYGKNRGIFMSLDDDNSRLAPRLTSDQIDDGSTKTMAMTECSGRGEAGGMHGGWPDGRNLGSVGRDLGSQPAINMERGLAWHNEQPRSDHPGGVNVLMADGAVRFLSEDVNRFVLRALASRDGGE